MDYKSLTLLSPRLTGVIILVVTVTAWPSTFVSLYILSNGVGWALPLTIVVSGFPILAGLLLIYFPGTIANRMISGGAEITGPLPFQQVGFSVLGLYFLTTAAADAVYWIAALQFGMNADFARLASTAVRLVAGTFLMFGGVVSPAWFIRCGASLRTIPHHAGMRHRTVKSRRIG
jgi:hypothetical protein